MLEVIEEISDEREVYFYDQLGCGRSERVKDKSFYTAEEIRLRSRNGKAILTLSMTKLCCSG